MKKGMFGVALGFLIAMVTAFNADAQMACCKGKAGGAMQGCCQMTGGMGHGDKGMMQGMHGGMHGDDMMRDDEHPLWKHVQCLGLDEKQAEALKALRTRTMAEIIRKKADKQIAKMELDNLLDKDVVDMKAVETSVKKIESLRTELFLAHLKAKQEVKAIVTPEQLKRLKDMMAMGHCGHDKGCELMHGDGDRKDDGDAEKKEPAAPMMEHKH